MNSFVTYIPRRLLLIGLIRTIFFIFRLLYFEGLSILLPYFNLRKELELIKTLRHGCRSVS